jgi:hypothetical protein
MSELQEIGDLRPAPRTTPIAVLWLMFLVVVGCACLFALPLHADAARPIASAASPQGPPAAVKVAATPADSPASVANVARTASR